MARNQKRAGERGREQRTKARNAGEGAAVACPSCGARAGPAAKFCQECGAPLDRGAAPRRSNAFAIVPFAGFVTVVFVAVAGLAYVFGPDRFEPPQGALRDPSMPAAQPAPSSAPSSAPAVDLSQMTPREAADRLFNRVMAADERGDDAEALRFAPMALQAYELVPELDADAHYHLGLLYGVTGDLDGLRRQIAALREYAPDHLLAYALEHELAEQQGDPEAAARAAAALADAYESEIATGRPEYAAHGFSIERLRDGAGGR